MSDAAPATIALPEQPTLSRREARFAREYVVDLSGAAAARRAGFAGRRADQAGYDMYRRPHVRSEIGRLIREREQETRLRAFNVLEELAIVTLSDIKHYDVDAGGEVTVKASAPAGASRAIAKMTVRRRETTRDGATLVEVETAISLWDKNPALTNALKHLGLTKDVVEHQGPAGGPVAHVHGWDLTKLSVEQLRQLEAITTAAAVAVVGP